MIIHTVPPHYFTWHGPPGTLIGLIFGHKTNNSLLQRLGGSDFSKTTQWGPQAPNQWTGVVPTVYLGMAHWNILYGPFLVLN
jgi:hypothetical protein